MQSDVNMHTYASTHTHRHTHTNTRFEEATVVTSVLGWGVEFPTIYVVFTEECVASPRGKILSYACGCVDGIIPPSL